MRKLGLIAALAGAMIAGAAIAAGLSTGNEFSTATPGKTVVGFVEMVWNASLGYAQPVSPANPLPVAAGPYQASPSSTASSDQHNLAITTATALTVPADALAAQVCVTGTKVNYRWDGTAPTASVGQPLLSGQCFFFAGRNILTALQFIQTAATATLDVTYSK